MKDIPWASNASATEVAYDGTAFCLEQIGMDAHLGNIRTVLSKNMG